MILRSADYLGEFGLPPADMLRSVIAEHQREAERYRRLRAAYDGDSQILSRRRRAGQPNNRIAHPYARYISTIATGYLIGQPVAYSTAEEHDTLQRIQEIFRRGSEAAENTQLARDQSICGKGVEYVHVDDEEGSHAAVPHVTAVHPENAFVAYSNTADMKALFGVYYLPRIKADGEQDGWQIWVMSDSHIARYATKSLTEIPPFDDVVPHFFGGVPLIEYWNDENERGDFEWVLSLIDAYDVLQSDRVNDKEQFVDRLLVLTGAVLETDERGRLPMEQLREDHALQLPDSQSKAEYLTSEMNEVSVEVLRKALVEDIHKLSMVPDMSDINFAANASGVAMRYKLLGFEQLIRVKQQWFTEGLRERLKLYAHFLEVAGMPALDVADVKIEFTHALPANLTENAQIAQMALGAGAASLRTAISMLHQGENWTDDDIDQETKAIQDERAEEARAMVEDYEVE